MKFVKDFSSSIYFLIFLLTKKNISQALNAEFFIWISMLKTVKSFSVLAFVSFSLILWCKTRSRTRKKLTKEENKIAFFSRSHMFCLGSRSFSSKRKFLTLFQEFCIISKIKFRNVLKLLLSNEKKALPKSSTCFHTKISCAPNTTKFKFKAPVSHWRFK